MQLNGLAQSGQQILGRQRTDDALRLLIAQRRMHRRAKRWSNARVAALTLGGLGAPIATLLPLEIPVVFIGATAGAALFLAGTLLSARASHWTRLASAVQEKFDAMVFGFDQPDLTGDVRPEDISSVLTDAEIQKVAQAERLLGWYAVPEVAPGVIAIALCQRSNAAYSARMQRAHARVLLALAGAWSLVILIAAWQLEVADFVVGVGLPVLPGALDLYREASASREAERARHALADSIERALRANGADVTKDALLGYQRQQYHLRRNSPQVPESLYRRLWQKNEQIMQASNQSLLTEITGGGAGGQGR